MKENMETKTPKIALCLSGLIRNSFFCFPYIYQNFLNQGLDCISHLSELTNELKRWHPESFLRVWLDKNNLKIQQDDYDYRIVKAVHVAFSWPEKHYNFKNI